MPTRLTGQSRQCPFPCSTICLRHGGLLQRQAVFALWDDQARAVLVNIEFVDPLAQAVNIDPDA